MRLLYFGRLAERAGTRASDIDLPPEVATVADLRRWLPARFPALGALGADIKAVIDDTFAPDNHPLAGVAEVAFLPPVSGG